MRATRDTVRAILHDGLPFSVITCTLLVSGPPKLPQGTVPAGRFLASGLLAADRAQGSNACENKTPNSGIDRIRLIIQLLIGTD